MRNQPKYNFFKNTTYALKGLRDLIKTETSFKIELALAIILIPTIIVLDTLMINKTLMFISLIYVSTGQALNMH